jgi:hypothetical protein
MAKSTTLSTLELKTPIDLESLNPPSKWPSRDFWKIVALSLGAIAAISLLSYLWGVFELPTFEHSGYDYSWLFPVQVAVTLGAVKAVMAAFVQQGVDRRERQRSAVEDILRAEAIPFVESELGKLDGIAHRDFSMPPVDWLCRQMTVGPPQGATWGSRISKDDWLSFAVRLEAKGHRVVFAVSRPEVIA